MLIHEKHSGIEKALIEKIRPDFELKVRVIFEGFRI
jgi:hypothetical protein